MAPRTNYVSIFTSILSELPAGEIVEAADILRDERLPSAISLRTKQGHLRSFLESNPIWLKSVSGIVPKPETIIGMVEAEFGKVTEANLVAANAKCGEIVNSITRPMVGKFIREELRGYYAGSSIAISEDRLLQFLIEEFATYLRAAGNGLVSVAGSINEKLLHRALLNAGMKQGAEFSVTGTDSEADIQIFTSKGVRDSLGVEVKSYAARERLLRGLRDVKEPKVGVGYFKNPLEFGMSRTVTYLQAKPAAIYMPTDTLVLVDKEARRQVVNERVAFGSVLYRPLEQFVTDMKAYASEGALPKFTGL